MLKAVFFDLDGTLLPMDENEFLKVYFHFISQKVKGLGYETEKLIDTIWAGTGLMYRNNGNATNEKVFWEHFLSVYGKERMKDKKYFDNFYLNEFKNTKEACRENELALDIVKFAKEKTGLVILSTNPIFPLEGIKTRIGFIGLKESDFDYITSYENSYHSKPNPLYFDDLLKKFNLKSDEVILFGNNDLEDYLCSKKVGIKCYLVGDNLILHDEISNNEKIPHIKISEVIETIEKEYNSRLK